MKEEKTLIKSIPSLNGDNKENSSINENVRAFFCESEVNKKLIPQFVSMNELRAYLNLKFLDFKTAANSAGISETRVRQILIGYKLPKRAELIQKIADGWGINPIKLAQLFEHLRASK